MINYQKYKNIRPRWISKIGGVSVILFSLMLFGCGASNSFQQAGRDKDDSSGKKEDPLKKITGIVAQRKAIYNLNKLQSEELKYNPPTPDDSYFLRRMKNLREMADIEKIERQDRLRADLQAMGKRELFGIVNESTKIEKLQGNKRAALINSGPAYFQDDNGKWKEIEPNFSLYKPKKITEKNYKYASLNNGTKILMAAQSGTVQTISLQKRGEKPLQWGAKKMGAVDQMGQVLWQKDAQKTDGELTKFDWRQRGPKFGEGISNPEDNMSLEQGQSLVETRLLYRNIFPQVDEEYLPGNNNVKHNLILHFAPADIKPGEYLYLESHLKTSLDLLADGKQVGTEEIEARFLEFVDRKGNTIYYVTPPKIYEQKDFGTFAMGKQRVSRQGDFYVIKTLVLADWLLEKERNYPVVIDPSPAYFDSNWGWQVGGNEDLSCRRWGCTKHFVVKWEYYRSPAGNWMGVYESFHSKWYDIFRWCKTCDGERYRMISRYDTGWLTGQHPKSIDEVQVSYYAWNIKGNAHLYIREINTNPVHMGRHDKYHHIGGQTLYHQRWAPGYYNNYTDLGGQARAQLLSLLGQRWFALGWHINEGGNRGYAIHYPRLRVSYTLPNKNPSTPTHHSPGNYSWTTDRTPQLCVKVSDPDGNKVRARFNLNGDEFWGNWVGSGQVSCADANQTGSHSDRGSKYNWRAYAYDDQGATSGWSGWWYVGIDGSAPNNFNSWWDHYHRNYGGVKYNHDRDKLLVKWDSADEPHSGISHYEVALGRWPDCTNGEGILNMRGARSYWYRRGMKDGDAYRFCVRAKNNAGLFSNVMQSDKLIIDASAPRAQLSAYPAVHNSRSNLVANWDSLDDHSGIEYARYAIGTCPNCPNVVNWRDALASYRNSSGTRIYGRINHSGLNLNNETFYFISLQVKNKAGHVSQTTTTPILIFANPPAVSIAPASPYSNQNLTLRYHNINPSAYSIKWYRNGSHLPGQDNQNPLPSSETSPGQIIKAEFYPRYYKDGRTYVGSTASVSVTIRNRTPNTPDQLSPCSSSHWYNTPWHNLRARMVDGDSDRAYGIFDGGFKQAGRYGPHRSGGWANSGSHSYLKNVKFNNDGIGDNGVNKFRVYGRDSNNSNSRWSGWCTVKVDAKTPGITSFSLPTYLRADQSVQGTWNVNVGPSGLLRYRYNLQRNNSSEPPLGWYSDISTRNYVDIGDRSSYGTNDKLYLWVRAQSKSGLWSSGEKRIVTVDKHAPNAVGWVKDEGTYTRSTSQLKFGWATAGDHGSGVNLYQYAVGTSKGATNVRGWTNVGTATSVTVSSIKMSSGTTYYISVRAIDNAGNVGSVLSSNGIKVDTTAPSIPSVTDQGSLTTSKDLSATWPHASDSESGIAEYHCSVGTNKIAGNYSGRADSRNIRALASVGRGTTCRANNLSLVHNQVYYFHVYARNNAGAWSRGGVSNGIRTDFSAPDKPAVSDEGDYSTNASNLTATWTAASEDASSISQYACYIGITNRSISYNDVARSLTFLSTHTANSRSCSTSGKFTAKNGNRYYFHIYAKNSVGLWSASGISNGILIDTTAPSVPAVSDSGTYTTDHTTLFASWSSASDSQSGIAQYACSLGTSNTTGNFPGNSGSKNIKPVQYVSENTTRCNFSGLNLQNSTNYYVHVYAKNHAGLWSRAGVSNGIKVDRNSPTAPKNVRDQGAYIASSTIKAFWDAAVDNESGIALYACSVGTGNSPGAYPGAESSKNVMGTKQLGANIRECVCNASLRNNTTYYFHIYARDNSGRWSQVAVTDGIKVDNSPPSKPIVNDHGTYTSSSTSLSGTWSAVSNNESGISQFACSIGTSGISRIYSGRADSKNIMGLITVHSSTTNCQSTSLNLQHNTTYYFHVYSQNNLGKWSAAGVSNGIKTDFTAPSSPAVYDQGQYTTSKNSLSASWSPASDNESGVTQYACSIGTSNSAGAFPGSANSKNTMDIKFYGAKDRKCIGNGANLTTGETYYFHLYAKNGAGVWSSAGVSDGIMVDFTAPGKPAVTDQGAYIGNTSTLSASWTPAEEKESPIAQYACSIGTSNRTGNYSNGSFGRSDSRNVMGIKYYGASDRNCTGSGLNLSNNTTYYFHIYAKNQAGLWSPAGVSNGIKADLNPPAIPKVRPNISVAGNNSSLAASWDASKDSESGINGYACSIGTSSSSGAYSGFSLAKNIMGIKSYNSNDRKCTSSALNLSHNTNYYFHIYAKDMVGNWSKSGVSAAIKTDFTPPTIPIVVIDAEKKFKSRHYSTKNIIKANWAPVSEPESELVQYACSIGTSPVSGEYPGSSESKNIMGLSMRKSIIKSCIGKGLRFTNGGTYYFHVYAKNSVGLWSKAGVSNGIKYDATPPRKPKILVGKRFTSSKTGLKVLWTKAEDKESGIAQYACSVGNSSVAGTYPGQAGAFNVKAMQYLGPDATGCSGTELDDDTTYYFHVYAENEAGIWSTAEVSPPIQTDWTPPSTPIVTDSGNYTVSNDSLTAFWSGSVDDESTVVRYACSIGTESTPGDYPGNANSQDVMELKGYDPSQTSCQGTGLNLQSGTTYYFHIYALNGAGLSTQAGVSDGIKVDHTAPSLPIVSDQGDYSKNQSELKATWTASSDPESDINQYKCSIGTDSISGTYDGLANSKNTMALKSFTSTSRECIGSSLALQHNSRYYFHLYARNRAGLWSKAGVSNGILMDFYPPAKPMVTVIKGDKPTYYQVGKGVYYTASENSLEAAWTGAQDDESGITQYACSIGESSLSRHFPGDVASRNVMDLKYVDSTAANCVGTDLILQHNKRYYFHIYAKNGANGWSAAGVSEAILVDHETSTAPTVTDRGIIVDSRHMTASLTRLGAIFSESIDNETGVIQYACSIGSRDDVGAYPGSIYSRDIMDIKFYSADIRKCWGYNLPLKHNTTYYFHIYAKNGAGTWSLAGVSQGTTTDHTAPDASTISDTGRFTSNSSTISAQWDAASDPESGIKSYACSIGTDKTAGTYSGTADSKNTMGMKYYGSSSRNCSPSSLNLQHNTTYYFHLYARNRVETWSSAGVTDGILYDATPAKKPIITDQGIYSANKDSLRASWSGAEDLESGVVEYACSIGTSSRSKVYPGDDSSQNLMQLKSVGLQQECLDLELSIEDKNKYYFHLYVKNGAGTWSTGAVSNGITIDHTPPETPQVIFDLFDHEFQYGKYDGQEDLYANQQYQDYLHFSWEEPTDPESGVSKIQYALFTKDDQVVYDWREVVGSNRERVLPNLNLNHNSEYLVKVKFKNGAGLWSQEGVSKLLLIDLQEFTSGTVSIDSVYTNSAGLSYINDSSVIRASWSGFNDPQSGIYNYLYSIGFPAGEPSKLTWKDAGAITNNREHNLGDLQLVHNQNYFFNVKARNQAGTYSQISSDQVRVDILPPSSTEVTVTYPAGVFTSETTVLSAAWSAFSEEAGESGIKGYFYRVVQGQELGGNFSIITYLTPWHSSNQSRQVEAAITSPTLQHGKRYYMLVKARDHVGNENTGNFHHGVGVTVDTTKPNGNNVMVQVNDSIQDDINYTALPPGKSGKISLNWDPFLEDISQVTNYYYQIERVDDSEVVTLGEQVWRDVVLARSVTSVESVNLESGKRYRARVKAVNNSLDRDGKGLESIVSSPVFLVDFTPPDQISAQVSDKYNLSNTLSCLASAKDQEGTPIHKFRFVVKKFNESGGNTCDNISQEDWQPTAEGLETSGASIILESKLPADDTPFDEYYFCVQAQNKTGVGWSDSVRSENIKDCQAELYADFWQEDFNLSDTPDFAGSSSKWQNGYSLDGWSTKNISGVIPLTSVKDIGADLEKPYGEDTPKDNYLVSGNSNWHNYVFTGRYRNLDKGAVGFVFRYKDQKNFYLFYQSIQTGPPEQGKLVTTPGSRLIKVKDGVPEILAKSSTTYSPGSQWHLVRIEVDGKNIRTFLWDDADRGYAETDLLFQVWDGNSIEEGKVGVYSYDNSGVVFDQLVVDLFEGFARVTVDGRDHPFSWQLAQNTYRGQKEFQLIKGAYNLAFNCVSQGLVKVDFCGEADLSTLTKDPDLLIVKKETDSFGDYHLVTITSRGSDRTMCKKALTAEIASNIEMDDKISEDQTGAVFSGEFNGSGASQEKACLAETGVCPGDNSLSAQVQGYPLAAPLEYISSFSPQKAVSQGNRILVGAGQEYILQAPLVKGATYNWKLDISRPGESRRILARAPLVPSFFEAGFQAMVNGSIVMTGQTAVEVVASRPLFSIKERILPYPFVWPLNIDQKYSEEIGQQKGSYYLSTLLVQRLLTISGVLLSSVEAEEENRNAAMEKFTAIPFTGQIDEGSLRVNGPGKSCLLAEVTAQGTVVARPVNYLVVAVPLLQAISIGDGNTGFVPQHYLLFRPRDGWRFGRRYIVALNDNLEIVKGLPVEKSYALSTGTNVQKDSLTKYNPDLARHLDKLITSLNDPDFVRNNVVIIYDFEVLND